MWRTIFNLILVLLVGAAAAFVAAPWFAFRALKADARDGDVQGLAELVDYNAVRGTLKTQLGPTPNATTAPAPTIWTDPIGAMKRALEPLTPPPPAVERYVSAQGLHDLTRGYEPGKAPAEPQQPEGLSDQVLVAAQEPWPSLRYWGPNRSRFVVRGPDKPERETVFTFQRRGWFEWKLVQIRLPDDDEVQP